MHESGRGRWEGRWERFYQPAASPLLRAPGRYGDGKGLWLHYQGPGKASWILRYSLHGRRREMGLGSTSTLSLAEAREVARQARKLVLAGIDPIEHRRAERQQQRQAMTFAEAAEAFIRSHRLGWKSPKHAAQWEATLATYAFPVFGRLPVGQVDTSHVMRALEPIWATKPETASRLRGRIEAVLDWAAARGHRAGDNPARWRGHLANLLPARAKVRKVQHFAALPYQQLPSFIAELRAQEGIGARALAFAILTAARTGEVIGAKWAEIDLASGIWTISGDRMKAGREHRVPLSGAALAILRALPRESHWVFPGGRRGRPLSSMALLQVLRRMGFGNITAHGFRSTFRDWAAERTSFAREVAEAALAHSISDKVEAAYRRGDLFEKRRKLMDGWAGYATAPPRAGDVVPIRK
ncbi:MAG: integrase arm-type DNA-binding domain-containing protein [Anaerolineales bacterium]|nr:integrase arm-type DNA-binding domain-containing protein [Alphaproteobacteria bacterium]MCW5886772.1 integrase arm-type DNA-binding domain-containing protein [Anaerolineales bacterium]